MSLFTAILFSFSFAWAGTPEVSVSVMSGTQDFKDASIRQQKAILQFFIEKSPYGKFLQSYYLDKDSPALGFLNPELVSRLYGFNQVGSEANCYWTSLFAIGLVGLPERFMDFPEYLKLIETKMQPLDAGEEPQPGDVLRLQRPRGHMETHYVVVIGKMVGSSSNYIVLSKNGPADGPFLIMNLWDLQNRVYPSSAVVGVYRRR